MQRFKNILCIIDTETGSSAALQRAVTLARNNRATLTVVKVINRVSAGIGMPDGGPISIELQNALQQEQQVRLEKLIEPFVNQLSISIKILKGIFFVEVIREVLRNHHDLIIKTAHSENWLQRLFSSDDMHLLRKCPCPVWLLKPQRSKAFKRILVAVDVDDSFPLQEIQSRQQLNLQILQMASSLALAESAELHIAHVWQAAAEITMRSTFMEVPEEAISAYVEQVRQHRSKLLNKLVNELELNSSNDSQDYLKPQLHLQQGSAQREIPVIANQIDADLVVMGTVARTGIPGFIMGNTAETILNQLDCSVLAAKPAAFVSPVTLEQ
ncbi:MAG: universal stress protein [Gammaproteobacteria bacterium]|nr:universal stress protein [Gammaproteobacteria bacterium]MBL6998947.1 universal stress protein [Gammaproteobacteria bacterium]